MLFRYFIFLAGLFFLLKTPMTHALPLDKKEVAFSSDAEKRSWVVRTLKAFHLGKRPSPQDIARYTELTVDEFLDNIMMQDEFHHTFLDYSHYITGDQAESYRQRFRYGDMYFDYVGNFSANSAAIDSTVAFAQKDGALKILNRKVDRYQTRFFPVYKRFIQELKESGKREVFQDLNLNQSDRDIRDDYLVFYENLYVQLYQQASTQSRDIFCQSSESWKGRLNSDSPELLGFVMGSFFRSFSSFTIRKYCEGDEEQEELLKEIKDSLYSLQVARQYARWWPQYEQVPERVELKDLIAVPKELYKNPFILDADENFNRLSFYADLTNSSTNFNRKRAAHILRTYFCDDLVPLNVVPDESHKDGVHGSSPACFACHYKLDPMAGYFRGIGAVGIDFLADELPDIVKTFPDYEPGSPYFMFDDQKPLKGELLEKYYDTWRDKSGEREWNIGYIRSSHKTELNTYGESYDDLFTLLQTAPEVKRCFVQRAAEYFVDRKQTFDPDWIDALTDIFNSEENSAIGFHRVFRAIAKSNVFLEDYPQRDKCYDSSSNSLNSLSNLQCEVKSVIKSHCITCHSSHPLNMSTWISDENKPGLFRFSHVDSEGKQLPRDLSFQLILDRLQDSDPAKRMPLFLDMPRFKRDLLFQWAQQEMVK